MQNNEQEQEKDVRSSNAPDVSFSQTDEYENSAEEAERISERIEDLLEPDNDGEKDVESSNAPGVGEMESSQSSRDEKLHNVKRNTEDMAENENDDHTSNAPNVT